MKRFYFIIIALAMVALTWKNPANAQPVPKKPEGSGNPFVPYLISCASELYWLTQNPQYWGVGDVFVQVDHIDLKDYDNWGVIGTEATPFRGVYNGQGYTIRNLTIDSSGVDNIGLFGYVGSSSMGGYIINLGLINVNISGSQNVGSFVGKVWVDEEFYIQNSYVSGGKVVGSGVTGGLVGGNNGTSVLVNSDDFPLIDCSFSDVDVVWSGYGGGDRIGGLVGCNGRGVVRDSYSRGDVLVENVNGIAQVGERVGGLCGSSDDLGVIEYSYSSGQVTVTDIDYVGGLTGYLGNGSQEGTVRSSFYDQHTDGQGQASNPDMQGGNNINTLGSTSSHSMLDPDTYTINNGEAWDDVNTWYLEAGEYPRLLDAQTGTPLPVELTLLTARTKGDEVQVYWSTATETNNHYYEIQASSCGYSYTVVGTVPGSGTTSHPTSYSWSFPYSPDMRYVRLWQVDYDGSGRHLGPVDIRKQNPRTISLTVYPNPAGEKIYIRPETLLPKGTPVRLYSLDGKCLLDHRAGGGSYPMEINIPDHISPGTYLIKVGAKNPVTKLVTITGN